MSPAIPKPEYPRPDRDRSERWLTLNGDWDFESVDGSTTIVVPFAWETPASGVQRTWLERARYRRSFTAPAEWSEARIFLCFGAVHHRASVTIDGRPVGEHVGGYDSFEFDVTDFLAPDRPSELEVLVEAPQDKRGFPHGKQRSIPKDDYDGVSFTPTSGIWQSVWLEARGRTFVREVELRGDSLTGIDVDLRLAGDAPPGSSVTVRVVGATSALTMTADANGRAAGRLELEEPRLWSPADPHLYSLELTVGTGPSADRVVCTAGLRSVEIRGEHLLLNGQRLYVRGVLDQGYWPDSGLTAPDDAALMRDLELARDLGFTLVRKHLKFEEPRWLHHADRLGMLVWAEPACTSRFSAESVGAFEAQIAPMVERDGNHPSIIIWGLYNEEWGLDWDIPGSSERAAAAVHAYDLLRALDPTRPIVENSGWAHVKTDLVDWHYYEPDPGTWSRNLAEIAGGSRTDFPVKLGVDFTVDKSLYAGGGDLAGLPILNSEFGEGFTSLERAWHVRWQTQEIRRHDRFAGYVYTEFADVEHEMAGLLDADRRRKDWGGLDPADVNADTVIVVDLVPRVAGADIPLPVDGLSVDVRISHHGTDRLDGQVRAAWVAAGTPFGPEPAEPASESALVVDPFVTGGPVTLRLPPPGVGTAARLQLWFVDGSGTTRARTFVDAGPIEEPNRRGARLGDRS